MPPFLASRICGSADVYQWNGRLPRHSVNFITSHDGFTLSDLVSYDDKHNEANGEANRDGWDENYSWNCGAEGETNDADVLALRDRQVRNLMATLMLSQGVPMILGGDEFLRTQKGNNNAWCQDNEVSWVDWELAKTNADFLRFTKEMIGLRKRHPVLRRRRFFAGELRPGAPDWQEAGPFPPGGPVRPEEAGLSPGDWPHVVEVAQPFALTPAATPRTVTAPAVADIHWHGTEPHQPDFSHYSRVLAFSLDGRFPGQELGRDPPPCDADFYVAMNACHEALNFRIPASPTRRPWRRVVDTAEPSPADFIAEGEGPLVSDGTQYTVEPYSLVVLVSEG